MSEPSVVTERHGSVLRVRLNRPRVHNALDGPTIEALDAAMAEAAGNDGVRVVVVEGEGKSFCAGADLQWMRAALDAPPEAVREESLRLYDLFDRIARLPRPVVARVHGVALGGGVGLVAACDIAIAEETAEFGLSEVRLGLAPAVISPHVVARIGQGAARRLFLTGERFGAAEAWRLGLVSDVVDTDELDDAVGEVVEALLLGGPRAQRACKALALDVLSWPPEQRRERTADLIARLRTSDEGQEGMRAFFERRDPRWRAAR